MNRKKHHFETSERPPSTDTTLGERLAEDDYWYKLISEKIAATFVDLSTRTLQGLRQKGDGPPFIRLSARSCKYRRSDLRAWAEKHLRISTSDNGL
jgi:hypothetical protein